MRQPALIDELGTDVRFAARAFARHALLSTTVVVTLTAGIGFSSGIFTLFDAAVLRSRVAADPASYAEIFVGSTTDRSRPGGASLDELSSFTRARTVRALSAHHRYMVPFARGGDEKIPAMLVTCGFFDTIGSGPPLAGRLLVPEDCDSAAPVAVIDEALWRNRFHADPGTVGASIDVNGAVVTVVGIAPEAAAAVDDARVWMPLTLRRYLSLGEPSRTDRWLSLEGRLAPGATRRQAAAELAVLASGDGVHRPADRAGIVVTDGSVVSDPRKPLVVPFITLVMSALSCLVLIACANIAVLLLSHADARQQEIAIRLSLGAGRGRLLRMLLTETLLLSACAGAASIWVAYQVPVAMFKWFGAGLPAYSLAPDWRAFTFLTLTTVLAGVAAGLAPALESMRVDVLDMLKGRRSLLGAGGGSGLRNALTGVQIALSFVLLVGAGLFGMTHYRIVTGEPGFEASHLLIARADATPAALRRALSGLPGARAIGFARTGPVLAPLGAAVWLDGISPQRADLNEVSPDYFRVIGLPILRGRGLEAGDSPCGTARCHVVVSEAFVQRILGSADPLGRVVRTATGDMEIVGVARDLSAQQIGAADPPIVYLPWTAMAPGYQAVVRFDGDPSEFSRSAAAALRRSLPATTFDARTARWYIDAWLEEIGPLELLIFALGGAASALAVIGVFGVVSFNVSRRRRELGIRTALGARPADIYAAVLGSGLKPAAAGLGAGALLASGVAVAFGSVLSQMHFAVSARDPLTYGIVAGLLGAAIVGAQVIPARRAARLEPFLALRCD